MINRRSVPALHRACLHQRDQPDTNNSGRCFTFLPIENGHDSDLSDAEFALVQPLLLASALRFSCRRCMYMPGSRNKKERLTALLHHVEIDYAGVLEEDQCIPKADG
jgi:hypothetical protein